MAGFHYGGVDPVELDKLNAENVEMMQKIGARIDEGFWAAGLPQIALSDAYAKKTGQEFAIGVFKGRLIFHGNIGILSTGINPFPCGPSRISLIRWGAEPDQCGMLETWSTLNHTSIVSYQKVFIGKHVLFGPDAVIMDCDGHPADRRLADIMENKKIAPVTIEDHAWICHRAVIMKGVTVGHHAVVATNAVVTRDVPPHCVVAGNPAKVVRDFSESEPRGKLLGEA